MECRFFLLSVFPCPGRWRSARVSVLPGPGCFLVLLSPGFALCVLSLGGPWAPTLETERLPSARFPKFGIGRVLSRGVTGTRWYFTAISSPIAAAEYRLLCSLASLPAGACLVPDGFLVVLHCVRLSARKVGSRRCCKGRICVKFSLRKNKWSDRALSALSSQPWVVRVARGAPRIATVSVDAGISPFSTSCVALVSSSTSEAHGPIVLFRGLFPARFFLLDLCTSPGFPNSSSPLGSRGLTVFYDDCQLGGLHRGPLWRVLLLDGVIDGLRGGAMDVVPRRVPGHRRVALRTGPWSLAAEGRWRWRASLVAFRLRRTPAAVPFLVPV